MTRTQVEEGAGCAVLLALFMIFIGGWATYSFGVGLLAAGIVLTVFLLIRV